MRLDRRTFLALAAATSAAPSHAFKPHGAGRVETLAPADLGPGSPRVRVWLPADFQRSGRAYRSLYMLDGQFAFVGDSEGTNFAADQRVLRLVAAETIRPTVIVAIDNLGDDRFLQYMPQPIYDRSRGDLRDLIEVEMRRVGATALVSAPFVRFLQDRLKPLVDARYGTSHDRLDTAIFGASMAGVMAGAIFVEASGSFGLGACMSPNWAIYDQRMIDHPELPSIWYDYFGRLGAPGGRRLWLDHGTQMMDAGMAAHQRAIARSLTGRGWRRGWNLQTRVYEAGHAYAQTAVQMDEVLAWLLA